MIAIHNSHEIVYINQTGARLLGASSPEELIGKSAIDFIHPEYQDEGWNRIRHIVEDGKGIETVESKNLRVDGSVIDVEVTAGPIVYQGEPAAQLVVRDITDRQRAEANLQDANVRLEQALLELRQTKQEMVQQERLRALGMMASGIAHDLNNTLSPILAYSDLLLSRPEALEDKENLTPRLETINRAGKDAAEVIRRLREFYRPENEQEILGLVNVEDLFGQTVMLTQPNWKDQAQEKGIDISIETELEEVLFVNGSEAELREVLVNLILNAVDALPKGGTISPNCHRQGDNVLISVRDTGIGMSEEMRQRCLEPFATTKGELGTGLGLAIAYGIVQRHGGSLDVETAIGRGTKVTISLPVASSQVHSKAVRPGPGPIGSMRILLIDDEPIVLQSVSEMLTQDGHLVKTACNGRDGYKKFNASAFDLVIVDRAMPGMNGDQLAAAIKNVGPEKPVILLTGFGDIMEASGERPEGVDLVVSKPVTLIELRQAMLKVTGP